MEKTVAIYFNSFANGQWISAGTDFHDFILKQSKFWQNDTVDNDFKLQLSKISELEGDLEEIFKKNIEFDFEFASRLQLYDTISLGCFLPKSEIGKAFLQLMDLGECIFVLSDRTWESPNYIVLDFEMGSLSYLTEIKMYLKHKQF